MIFMKDLNVVPAVPATKKLNYTPEMVTRMRALAPLNLEKATLLALEFGGGKSAKSVIAKAKREGIEYQAKIVPTKKAKNAPTKKELVEVLSQVTGLRLFQLEKAPALALQELCAYIARIMPGEVVLDANETGESDSVS